MSKLRSQRRRVAIVSIDAVGHVNPMLAIGAAIARHPDCSAIKAFGPRYVADAFRRHGLDFDPFGDAHELDRANDLVLKTFIRPLIDVRAVLDRIKAFSPDAILYDCFSIYGWLAARVCDVPGIALVSVAGYGALGDTFIKAHSRSRLDVEEANRTYAAMFGVDFIAGGYLPVFFPSERSIVTTLQELALSIDPVCQPLSYERFSHFEKDASYVGPCSGAQRMSASEMRSTRPAAAQPKSPTFSEGEDPFPYSRLEDAKRQSRHIVLMSLGTVITYSRFDIPVGGAPSGREFLEKAIQTVLGAIADDPRYMLVLATGLRFGNMGSEVSLPSNVIMRPFVPQRELLEEYVDVFVTHHGANSQTESLKAGVPMISLPGAGDQIGNARLMMERGAAIAFWDLEDPFGTFDARSMRKAIDVAIHDTRYRRACMALRDKLRRSDGPSRAADFVLEQAVSS